MKLTYVLIPVLILALLAMGCEPTAEETTPWDLPESITSTDGLAIEFGEGEPPDEPFEQDDFYISLEVKNDGDYTIEEGGIIASLSGINKNDFSLNSLDKKSNFELGRKIEEEAIEGETNTLDFTKDKSANYNIDLATDFKARIRADVCYEYRTRAEASVCLKKDTRQYKTGDACAINNPDVEFESSAAPIGITDVSESPSGKDAVKVKFTIENNEGGGVYKPGTFSNKCTKEAERDEEDYVFVELTDPAGRLRFKCGRLGDSNEGYVRLHEYTEIITCSLDTNGLQEEAYTQPVTITVDYFYRSAIGKEITIKNADIY